MSSFICPYDAVMTGINRVDGHNVRFSVGTVPMQGRGFA